jgi:hypothetical protein
MGVGGMPPGPSAGGMAWEFHGAGIPRPYRIGLEPRLRTGG